MFLAYSDSVRRHVVPCQMDRKYEPEWQENSAYFQAKC